MNARVCLAILLVCSLVLMKTAETNAAPSGKETTDNKGSDKGGKGDANSKGGMCLDA